jgi:hypothetical protein
MFRFVTHGAVGHAHPHVGPVHIPVSRRMDPARRLAEVASVAFTFAVALHAFGFIVPCVQAVTVAPRPFVRVRRRRDLRDIAVAYGTLARRFPVVVAGETRFHCRIVVVFHPRVALRFRMAELAVGLAGKMFDMRKFELFKLGANGISLNQMTLGTGNIPVAVDMALPAFVVHGLHARDALVTLHALLDAGVVPFFMVAGDARHAGFFVRPVRHGQPAHGPSHTFIDTGVRSGDERIGKRNNHCIRRNRVSKENIRLAVTRTRSQEKR